MTVPLLQQIPDPSLATPAARRRQVRREIGRTAIATVMVVVCVGLLLVVVFHPWFRRGIGAEVMPFAFVSAFVVGAGAAFAMARTILAAIRGHLGLARPEPSGNAFPDL